MTDSTDRTVSAHEEAGMPRAEPWVKLVLASLLPGLAAIYVPRAWQLPLFVLMGLLLAAGIAMLVVQERRRDR